MWELLPGAAPWLPGGLLEALEQQILAEDGVSRCACLSCRSFQRVESRLDSRQSGSESRIRFVSLLWVKPRFAIARLLCSVTATCATSWS